MTTPTTTKPATKTTSARKPTVPAKPATTTRTTRKPAAEKLSAQIASATGAETDKPALTVVGGSGTSATGDNGHGHARAAAQRAKTTTRKPAADAAAKPVRTVKRPAAENTGPTPTQMKRTVADWMAKIVADGLAKWNEKATGVPAEFARQMAASYLNYAPIQNWDARLGDRSHAGGRGASKRA